MATRSNYVKTGEAARLYRERERHTRDGVKRLPHPGEPLLYVPQNTAELLAGDLRRAGIEVTTANGKVDFHALRVTGITLASMATPDVDVVRIFARHASLAVTQGYIKTRLGRVIGVVERVGEKVIAPLAAMFGNGISTEQGKSTETNKGATDYKSIGCALFRVASPTGLEPVFSD